VVRASLTDRFDLTSQRRDGKAVQRAASTLWEESGQWNSNGSLTTGVLDGFPCVIVHRGSWYGEAIRFVDPSSVQSIRKDLLLDAQLSSLLLAGGRWLVVFLVQSKHRIAVFDLTQDTAQPASHWFARDGEVYEPVLVSGSESAFSILFVLHQYSRNKAILCHFRWPLGEVEELASFSDLHILPVESQP
jgi:hypothetical protein